MASTFSQGLVILGLFLGPILAALCLVLFKAFSEQEQLEHKQFFIDFAKSKGGKFTVVGTGENNDIHLYHRGHPCTLFEARGSHHEFTHFLFPLKQFAIGVFTASIHTRTGDNLSDGIREDIGLPDFRNRFYAVTSDKARLVSLLSSPIQEALLAISEDGLTVSMHIDYRSLRITINEKLTDKDELESHYRRCLTIVDELLTGLSLNPALIESSSNSGLVIVELKRELRDGEAICPVCGVSIDKTAFICNVCGTPHHKECWDYTNQCSIYGCGCRHGAEIPL